MKVGVEKYGGLEDTGYSAALQFAALGLCLKLPSLQHSTIVNASSSYAQYNSIQLLLHLVKI